MTSWFWCLSVLPPFSSCFRSVCGLKGVWESEKLECCQLVLLAGLLCLYTEGSIRKCVVKSCEKVTFHCHRLGKSYLLYLNWIFHWWKVVPEPFISLMHLGRVTLVVNHQKLYWRHPSGKALNGQTEIDLCSQEHSLCFKEKGVGRSSFFSVAVKVIEIRLFLFSPLSICIFGPRNMHSHHEAAQICRHGPLPQHTPKHEIKR